MRALFCEWYGSWLQFMLEFRFVGGFLAGTPEADGTLRPGAAPKFDSLPQIEALEAVFYQSSREYLGHVETARSRARQIADRTIELHNADIRRSRADA